MKWRLPALSSAAMTIRQPSIVGPDVAAAVVENPTAVDSTSSDDNKSYNEKRPIEARDGHTYEHSDEENDEKLDTKAQYGTQAAQAMTQVWGKKSLITAYIMIWLIEFVLAFSNGVTGTLTPYVTSSFQEHSLTALTSVIAYLIAGIFKLPYAKIMDIWGRPQALCLMVGSVTLGLIMMAGCNNVGTYCAAQVFYWMGLNGIDFSLTVFIADTSKLKNRGLMIAYSSSPYLITTWVYGLATDNVLTGIGFRWGFGVFAIVVPLVCAPFVAIMLINQNKAQKQGLIPARPSHGSLGQTIAYYAKEFDVAGLLILATGLSLFLLAFNLYSYQVDT